jgi:fimbrial isopeptide formation D2 family protein/uncharacterized repeat protein (TIGR01451 family)
MIFRKMKETLRAMVLLMVLATVMGMAMGVQTVTAKSLYLIADKGHINRPTVPVQAYDIGSDGALAFQVQCEIPREMLGALGIAIDSDAGYLFITYDTSNQIHMVDARTMTNVGTTTVAPEDADLVGIVYDHKKQRLYCAEVGTKILHVYDWQPQTATLTPVLNSPVNLKSASAYGIALDEVNDHLYVANASNTITVYSTSNWALIDSITLNRIAVSVAVDVENNFIYTGGGYAGNMHLTQYHLATGTKREVQVEPDAGVMGLGVDPDTGFVYISTGRDNLPGGDTLMVFDTSLSQIDAVPVVGNPTGLAIPSGDMGYNPLNLGKTVVEGALGNAGANGFHTVSAGDTLTYAIHFDNHNGLSVTDVSIVDTLPEEVAFVSAVDGEADGRYDSKTHTYQWSYASVPPGSSMTLELTAQVNSDIQAGTVITNTVQISSKNIAPTTKSISVESTNNALNLSKTISAGIDDQVEGIDINEPISYTIAFDNNNNDFPVTDVSIVDFLPDEVAFVATDKGKVSGAYDAVEHTYTWDYPFLQPGEAVSLDLVVQVDPDTPPGTIITNSAMISSNETPPSVASVDTITYFKPLILSASVVESVEGELRWVGPKEEVAYTIQFHNRDNDSAVTNVSIVDKLPQQVSFVRARADDHGVTGRYDAKAHTYTWTYPSLSPTKTPISLDLVVQVNKNAPPATIISNSVTIDSDQTRPTMASADVITYYKALNLSTVVIGSVIGEAEWIDANDTYAYNICFDNGNESAVTNVFIVDTLPKEVQFVSADGDGEFGWYDPKAHAYTWSYPSLAPGAPSCLEIVTRLNPGTPLLTTVTNFVTIDSDETLPATTSVEVVVGESPLEVRHFSILPEIIRDTDQSYEIQATAIFPAGIGRDDIKEVLPTLYPGRLAAKRQIIYGSSTTVKVIALFDKADLLNAVSDSGEVTLTVVGKLTMGRSWYGRATVYITGFTGR